MNLNENLKLDWGTIKIIKPKDIAHEPARNFVRDLRVRKISAVKDIYLCSDTRNKGLKQILSHLGSINIYASAGNVVEKSNKKPSIIIAHGKSDKTCGCGAVDYVTKHGKDEDPEFPGLASQVIGNPIENAKRQLEKIPAKWRAGILYFDHCTGEIHDVYGNEQYEWYSECRTAYNILKDCLIGRYTNEEIDFMAGGQDPSVIFLNNFNARVTAFDVFRVDLQGNGNRISSVVSDSLGFSMGSALKGEGSFKSSKSVVLAFDTNNIPPELGKFLKEKNFIKDYVVKKGGNLYVVEVGAVPNAKTIYQIIKKNDQNTKSSL